jgi:uncharacterized membrane protein (DUF106 family)
MKYLAPFLESAHHAPLWCVLITALILGFAAYRMGRLVVGWMRPHQDVVPAFRQSTITRAE